MITDKLKALILEALEISYIRGQKDWVLGICDNSDHIDEVCRSIYESISNCEKNGTELYKKSYEENMTNCFGYICEELYKIRVTLENSR